ncbi:MAG: dihydrodipicolinate synthase family protein [Caldilineaceae bacterium]
MTTFSGAWPALVTPFTDTYEVNVPVLRRVVDYLVGKQIGGFYVCGSTGEGVYMPVAQRKQVLELAIEQTNGRVPVIAHVGTPVAADAAELAHHAQEAGADGVASIIPPLYNTTASVVQYFAGIGAAAPNLPLFSYIFGGPTDAVALMRELSTIPTLAGAKYTGPNMFELRRIIDLGQGQWTIFSGMDEQCLFAAMFGANGCIGSSLNYHAAAYREMQQAVKDGDHARGTALQLRANQTTATMFEFGFFASLKAVMQWIGFDCGKPRLPNLALPEEKRQSLYDRLSAVGFMELVEL